MDSFFLGFSSKYKHSRLRIFKLFSAATEWSSGSQWNLLLDNPKHVWGQQPLDLTRDSHTQQNRATQKNVARVFSFILKTKHKTLHIKWAWAELENSAEKHSTRVLIDRARHNCTINYVVTRFQHYIKHIHFEQV